MTKKINPPSTGNPGGGGGVGGGGSFGAARQSVREKASASSIKSLFGTIFIGCKSK